ncbi:hypothetical protein BOTBODRAFT_105785, partial [Botryobasidium botryosum FD-172 SS1]
FISFFFLQPKQKKKTKIKKGQAKKRKCRQLEPMPEAKETVEVNIDGDELTGDKALDDLALETACDNDIELATHTGTTESPEQAAENGKTTMHDKAIVWSIKQQAIIAAKALGIEISPVQEKVVLGIFPKAVGAAQHVRDVPALRAQFDLLLMAQNKTDKPIQSDAKILRPHEPTRWNCDFDCLSTHILFRPVVEKLTAGTQNDLKAYEMTKEQWDLGGGIVQVLAVISIFDLVTNLFSKKEVPLVHQTIPILEDIEKQLKRIVNQDCGPVPAVVRVAAQAAILVQNKYYHLTRECEVYQIALILCPDKKLSWFADNNQSTDEIESTQETVTRWFNNSYNNSQSGPPAPAAPKRMRSSVTYES